MTVTATQTISPTTEESWEPSWEPNMPPVDLIFDDGEPLETYRHRIAMNLLIRSLHNALAPRNDFFAGGNMFVYYSTQQTKNKDFRGPDFFVVLDIDGSYSRQGWVVWEEAGRYPDIIVELMSPSTAQIDLTTKKDLYEKTFRTRNYFVYNPFNPNSLRGWCLDPNQRYQELKKNDRGWLWCSNLGLWLGSWYGTIQKDTCYWLRFYDSDFNLLLLPEEAEQKRADAEQQRADEEQQRADEEQQRADAERKRADEEQQRADTERKRAELLAARLKELGYDPDTIK